ncbi:hypothetical protein Ancab_023479 [Ancistrocladus abbreviatus]
MRKVMESNLCLFNSKPSITGEWTTDFDMAREDLEIVPPWTHYLVLVRLFTAGFKGTTQFGCIPPFVYGRNLVAKRKLFWYNLKQFATTHDDPWIVLGDFNPFLSPEDKEAMRVLFSP